MWKYEASPEMHPPHRDGKKQTASEENRSLSVTYDENGKEVMNEQEPLLDVDSVQQET